MTFKISMDPHSLHVHDDNDKFIALILWHDGRARLQVLREFQNISLDDMIKIVEKMKEVSK